MYQCVCVYIYVNVFILNFVLFYYYYICKNFWALLLRDSDPGCGVGQRSVCLHFQPEAPCDSIADGYRPPFERTSTVTKGSIQSRLKIICGLVSAPLIDKPCYLGETTFP